MNETRSETDEELQKRLFYVTGNHHVYNMDYIQLANYAHQFGLHRRIIRFAAHPMASF